MARTTQNSLMVPQLVEKTQMQGLHGGTGLQTQNSEDRKFEASLGNISTKDPQNASTWYSDPSSQSPTELTEDHLKLPSRCFHASNQSSPCTSDAPAPSQFPSQPLSTLL